MTKTEQDLRTKLGHLRARCGDLGRDKQILINEVRLLTELVVEMGGESRLTEIQDRLSDEDNLTRLPSGLVADLEERLWEARCVASDLRAELHSQKEE